MKYDTSLQQLIAYYRSCYELDSKQLELHDFFSKKNTNRLIVASSNLLKNKTQKVNFEWGYQVEKKLRVYGKEVALYANAYFLETKISMLGRVSKVSIPLFFVPIELVFKSTNYTVEPTGKPFIVNPYAVRVLVNLHPTIDKEEVIKALESFYYQKFEDKSIELLKQKLPNINLIPDKTKFYSNANYKKALKTKVKNVLHPVLGLSLLTKPSGSVGVLNELKDIALNHKFFPQLIESVFLGTNFNFSSEKKEIISAPVDLSVPQENIIKSAYLNNLTLVVGPPGTGKSFTISTIVADAIANGKTVLISSKNDQALQVISDKLANVFKCDMNLVDASQKHFERKIRKRINLLLSLSEDYKEEVWLGSRLTKLEKSILNLLDSIKQLKESIKNKSKSEVELSELLLDDKTFTNRVKTFFKIRKQQFSTSLASDVESLDFLIKTKNEWIEKYLVLIQEKKTIDFVLQEDSRHVLKQMMSAIDSDSGFEKESIFHSIDFKKVLKAFPVWLVNLKELNSYLPLQNDIFDLVIIDEATQCDIASSIPLIFRGKRAVVVGDPKQLRHVSFMSYQKQDELATKYDVTKFNQKLLDYRNSSILDVVMETLKSQSQVHYLDEHYRSMPDIIGFSNKEFYNSSLNIMTYKSQEDLKGNVKIIEVKGERNSKGINEQEIEAIFKNIKEKLSQSVEIYSVGIISPFAKQVKEIQKKVIDYFSREELAKMDLLIGTPFHFQGEERDHIHLSFVVDNNTNGNVFTYLNRADVFNVAITRARKVQFLYVSIDNIPFGSDQLLHRYLLSVNREKKIDKENTSLDLFLNEVKEWLQGFNLKIRIAYEIAGVEVDLLVETKDQLYAIDLVGYPGVFQSTFPVAKYQTLHRMNVEVMIVSYSKWLKNNEEIKKKLKVKLGVEK